MMDLTGDDMELYPLEVGNVLTSLDWIEMRHQAMLGSRWRAVMTATPEAGFFGVVLWNESIRQDPAGTLPDDDQQLCQLAGLGQDIETWQRLRAGPHGGPLYGWSRCLVGSGDDGGTIVRLHHKEMTVIAARAFGRLRKHTTGRGDATRRNRISRLRAHLRKIGMRSVAVEDEAFCDRVLSALDAEGLTASLPNVRAAVERMSVSDVTQVIDFPKK